ncbi:MAG: hypothetical protein ACRCS8_01010 [Brevinema sp.]
MKKMTFAFLVSLFAIGTSFAQNSEVKFDIASGSSFVVDVKNSLHFKSDKVRAMYTNEKGEGLNFIFDLDKVISSKVALYKKGNKFIGVQSIDSNTVKISPVQDSEKAALDPKNITITYKKSDKKLVYTPTSASEK